jgi:hypothetical protein
MERISGGSIYNNVEVAADFSLRVYFTGYLEQTKRNLKVAAT